MTTGRHWLYQELENIQALPSAQVIGPVQPCPPPVDLRVSAEQRDQACVDPHCPYNSAIPVGATVGEVVVPVLVVEAVGLVEVEVLDETATVVVVAVADTVLIEDAVALAPTETDAPGKQIGP